MKQKITKGKVVQHCLKVTAAIVVAGGVGFQFHEIQGLEKDLDTLNNKHTKIVQELDTTTKYANELESQNKKIVLKTDKLSKEVKALQKDKKALQKDKKSLKQAKEELSEKNKELKAKEKELNKKLIEERERPRRVTQHTSTSKANVSTTKESTTNVSTAKAKQPSEKAPVAPTNVSSSSSNKVVSGTASAYTANCKGCTGTTASGDRVSDGMVAMDKWVPLGTKVRITIPGYGTRIYTVSDRGGAIKGNRVDIYMDSQSEAVEFGMREVKIEILD